jgi:hypothetical protein
MAEQSKNWGIHYPKTGKRHLLIDILQTFNNPVTARYVLKTAWKKARRCTPFF